MVSTTHNAAVPLRTVVERPRHRSPLLGAPQMVSLTYAAIDTDSAKLMIVCFSCESTSSAMVITSIRSKLKSTTLRLVCKVWNILTCNMRDSSIIIGIE